MQRKIEYEYGNHSNNLMEGTIMKIGFIGLGLIGGSLAKTIKRIYPETELLATSGHLSTITAAFEIPKKNI